MKKLVSDHSILTVFYGDRNDSAFGKRKIDNVKKITLDPKGQVQMEVIYSDEKKVTPLVKSIHSTFTPSAIPLSTNKAISIDGYDIYMDLPNQGKLYQPRERAESFPYRISPKDPLYIHIMDNPLRVYRLEDLLLTDTVKKNDLATYPPFISDIVGMIAGPLYEKRIEQAEREKVNWEVRRYFVDHRYIPIFIAHCREEKITYLEAIIPSQDHLFAFGYQGPENTAEEVIRQVLSFHLVPTTAATKALDKEMNTYYEKIRV